MMDERQEKREQESEVQERMEEVKEEGIEEIEERPEAIEEAVEEEERCEEDTECHSSAKRARMCGTFTDSQEISIVEFVKQHPELYDKEHPRFNDVSQRTRYGKLSKLQSGQAPREMIKRQSWVYQQMGFLRNPHQTKGSQHKFRV